VHQSGDLLVPGFGGEGQQVLFGVVTVLGRDLGQGADDGVDHRRAQPAARGSSAGGGSDSGDGCAVEIPAGCKGAGPLDHSLSGGFGNIGQLLEQPRGRTVSEEFHDTARLDFHEQRTDFTLGGPHHGEQGGDAIGQGHRVRSHHRFAVHTPRLPADERMFITRPGDPL
jgi:hypothetical protein